MPLSMIASLNMLNGMWAEQQEITLQNARSDIWINLKSHTEEMHTITIRIYIDWTIFVKAQKCFTKMITKATK